MCFLCNALCEELILLQTLTILLRFSPCLSKLCNTEGWHLDHLVHSHRDFFFSQITFRASLTGCKAFYSTRMPRNFVKLISVVEILRDQSAPNYVLISFLTWCPPKQSMSHAYVVSAQISFIRNHNGHLILDNYSSVSAVLWSPENQW